LDNWVENRRPLALPNGHLNRSDHHMPILSMMHGPTNDQLAEQV
tara:strand:+ start:417 stop:548 length:132 start_codon:yes stop_codon:yes gene_type:complete